MSGPLALCESDYEAIEAAVMETARGRWFLNEYTRRNRFADTTQVLEAIGRLAKSVQALPALPVPPPLLTVERPNGASAIPEPFIGPVQEMSAAILALHNELALLRHDAEPQSRMGVAAADLDAVVATTESATQTILQAAETVQDVGWKLRELTTDAEQCDRLEQCATAIFLACSFQDLSGQRIGKVVKTMHYLETRIAALQRQIAPVAPGDKRPAAPLPGALALSSEGLEQGHVDSLLALEAGADPAFIDDSYIMEPAAPRGAQQPVLPVHSPPTSAAAEGEPALLHTAVLKENPVPPEALAVPVRAADDILPDLSVYSFEEKTALFS